MGERKRRSKKRSASKQKLLKGFTLYLCHCVDYDEVAEALSRAGIRFQRHRDHFSGYAPDTDLLRKVGKRRWILITADKKQRVRPLERQLIVQFKVREFVFTSAAVGNIGELLVCVRRKMRNMCSRNEGPFVAAISQSGHIALRSLDGGDVREEHGFE